MLSKQAKIAVRYVVPTILSNVCFFLFTVIDGMFIGNGVSIDALGAVNLVLPFTLTIVALTMVAMIGGSTLFAVHIGRGETDQANQVFMHALVLVCGIALLMMSVGVLFTRPVCALLGANETYIDHSADYLFWYTAFIVPSSISFCLQAFCRNDEDPGLVAVSVICSTALNIFGDWLLVFPLQMGTAGAAIATGVSQVFGLLIILIHFIRKKGVLRFQKFRLQWRILRDICLRGLPEGISQIAAPIMTLCMNLVLVRYIGDMGVNVYSVISYVASLTLAVFFGTSEGLQPLIGQSYGAGREKEMRFYFRVGLIINVVGSAALIGLILLLNRPICTLFGADAATTAYTLQVMPKYAWGFVMMSVNVIISAYFYSTLRTREALLINVLRGIILDAAVILLLPLLFGANIIWFTFGIYEGLTAVAAVWLLRRSERNGLAFQKG